MSCLNNSMQFGALLIFCLVDITYLMREKTGTVSLPTPTDLSRTPTRSSFKNVATEKAFYINRRAVEILTFVVLLRSTCHRDLHQI